MNNKINIFDRLPIEDYKKVIYNNVYPSYSNIFKTLINKENIDKFSIIQDCDMFKEYYIYMWIDNDNDNDNNIKCVKDKWLFKNFSKKMRDIEDNSIHNHDGNKYIAKRIDIYHYSFQLIRD